MNQMFKDNTGGLKVSLCVGFAYGSPINGTTYKPRDSNIVSSSQTGNCYTSSTPGTDPYSFQS